MDSPRSRARPSSGTRCQRLLLAASVRESTLRRSKQAGETARLTRERFRRNRGGQRARATRAVCGASRGSSVRRIGRRRRRRQGLARAAAAASGEAVHQPFGILSCVRHKSVGYRRFQRSAVIIKRRRLRARPAHARMLVVWVAAVLADCEPPALFKKPFNPVLGETARHELGFVYGGSVVSVLEQVSHYPADRVPLDAYRAPIESARDALVEEGVAKNERVASNRTGSRRSGTSARALPCAGSRSRARCTVDIEGTRTFRVPIRECRVETLETSGVSPPGSSPSGGDGDSRGLPRGLRHELRRAFEGFFPTPRARTRAGQAHVVRCDRTGSSPRSSTAARKARRSSTRWHTGSRRR